MSALRIYDNPKGAWFRAGQYPALALSGAFADYVVHMAYESRVQIINAVGDCSVELLSSNHLPAGYTLRVDNDTSEVVLAWPAYAVTAEGSSAIINADFEAGDSDWLLGLGWAIGTWNWEYDGPDNDLQAYDGTKSAEYHGSFRGNSRIYSTHRQPCASGVSVTGSCQVQQGPSSANNTGGWVFLRFLDADGALISDHEGNHVLSGNDAEWHLSSVTVEAPAGTAFAQIGGEAFRKKEAKPMWLDSFAWNLEAGPSEWVGTDDAEPIDLCLRVRDSAGRQVDSCYVINGAYDLAITGTLADGELGVAYSSALTVIGGVPPYSNATILSGGLPPGLSLSLLGDTITVEGEPE